VSAALAIAGGPNPAADWQSVLAAGVLVMFRLSGLFVFAPIFSSPAIAPRIKAGFVFAMAVLLAPVVAMSSGAVVELGVRSVLGELAVGLVFGLTLTLLTETVLFASTLLGMQFSFSLVNLIDPVSKVETPVLGQLLGWVTTLVLLAAGLHRTLLLAVMRSFEAVPVGTFAMSALTGARLAHMTGRIFIAGVQLASPVMAAALVVEVTVALVGRISPQLPSTIMSVPLKTLVSYGVLIGSLALWPRFLETRFDALLHAATGLLR
jgi:flagellar biosynthetic protein FliR